MAKSIVRWSQLERGFAMTPKMGKAFRRLRGRARDGSPGSTLGDAPIDPFGEPLSASDLAARYSLLRAAGVAASVGPLPRYGEGSSDLYLGRGVTPDLNLFVSHRWEATSAPDPTGTAADSIRAFLDCLSMLGAAASLPPAERIAIVPSLRVHGLLQAAIALGNQRPFGPSRPAKDYATLFSDLRASPTEEPGAALLDRTTLFYDYSCIPQGINLRDRGNGAPQREVLKQALRQLHLLVDSSTVLSLRRSDDDYGNRAWCAAELAIGQPRWRHVVLRLDLLGTQVTDAQIMGEATPIGSEALDDEMVGASRENILGIDDQWQTVPFGWGVLCVLAQCVYFGQHQLEAKRAVPVMVTGRAPQTFRGQQAFLISVINRLANLSTLDA
jgi:hypothetical protein